MTVNTTSPTLIERLKDPDDHSAWNQFFQRYSPLIISYARRQNCTEDMVQEILQETMIQVMKRIPNFRYDPTIGCFRGYLHTITHARVMDAFRRHCRAQRQGADASAEAMETVEDSSTAKPGMIWDEQWDRNLLHQAIENVQQKINPWSYECFMLYVVQCQPVAEVIAALSKKYQMTLRSDHIYSNKNRIIRLLSDEVQKLKTELGE